MSSGSGIKPGQVHRACAARRASPPCARREGIAEGLYYSWSKEFLEAGKKQLAGDTGRQATSGEVKGLAPGDARLEGVGRRTFAGEPSSQKNMIGHGGGEE